MDEGRRSNTWARQVRDEADGTARSSRHSQPRDLDAYALHCTADLASSASCSWLGLRLPVFAKPGDDSKLPLNLARPSFQWCPWRPRKPYPGACSLFLDVILVFHLVGLRYIGCGLHARNSLIGLFEENVSADYAMAIVATHRSSLKVAQQANTISSGATARFVEPRSASTRRDTCARAAADLARRPGAPCHSFSSTFVQLSASPPAEPRTWPSLFAALVSPLLFRKTSSSKVPEPYAVSLEPVITGFAFTDKSCHFAPAISTLPSCFRSGGSFQLFLSL
jgi:hypothetical protein